jgi:hypothetical protein
MSSLKRRLVTKNSDLRKLKFGSDKLHQGSSKQPFIREPLPGVLEDNPNLGLLGGNTDFILRAGTLKRSEDDVSRLSTFLLDTTQGNAFITKQNLLSRTNVRSVGKPLFNQGAYSPTSTLAQIGVAGAGGHLLKQGINPFKDTQAGGDSSDPTLFSKVSDFVSGLISPLGLPLYQSHLEEIKNPDTNRLVNLKNNKLSNTTPESLKVNNFSNIVSNLLSGGNLLGSVFNLNLKPNSDNELFSYPGGPNSILGVGKTTIRRYSNSEEGLNSFTPGNFTLGVDSKYTPSKYDITKDNKSLDTKALGVTPKYASQNPETEKELTSGFAGDLVRTETVDKRSSTLTKDQLKSQPPSTGPKIREDFRKALTKKPNSVISDSLSYITKNIESRVNLGNPGEKGNRKNYIKGKEVAGKVVIADKINALQIYQSTGVIQNNSKNDLCDFRISIIDPNETKANNTFSQTFLHFRAFIDSFDDSMTSDWSGEKYMGRGENFYRYNGFDRTINMSFTAAAQSKGEMMPMYNKLNYLQSVMTPNYTPAGYYFGNLVKMHVGAYLYDVPGVLTSLTYTIPQSAPWEIAIGTEEEEAQNKGDIQVLPHIINVSLSFKPIHNFAPKLQSNTFEGANAAKRVSSFGQERFISLSRGNNSGYDSVGGIDPNSGEAIVKKEVDVNT